jgi:DNA-binding SARP family transcriptional activator
VAQRRRARPAAPARARCRRRAVDHLRSRGALDTAFDLVVESRQWDAAPALLRDAGLAPEGHRPRRLGRWLAACPEDVRRSPAGRLAGALVASSTTPATAVEPLRDAARACRDAGDVDAELCAVAHLGRLGWYRQDPTTMGPTERSRVAELAAAGHPQAQALAAFGRAVVADLAGDDAAVLRELAGIRSGVLQPEWEVMTGWLFGMVHLGLGDVDAALDLVERHGDNPNPAVRVVVDGVRMRAWWTQGRVDDVLAATPPLLDVVRTTGAAPGRHMVLTNASVLYSHTGDLAAARRLLDEGTAAARPQALPGQHVRTALAGAALRLAEGDEPAAAAALRQVVERHGLDRGVDRRGWRLMLGATYVLLPETRAHWDAQPLRGYLLTARHLAATLVAGRQPGAAPGRLLRRVELPDVGRIRSALPVAHAAELAAGLAAAGRPEAAALLEALGPAGRRSARALAEGAGVPVPAAKPARALLAALPAPPARALQVVTLGVLAVHEASPVEGEPGAEVTEPELRRQRVRELLAFLLGHRRTTRDAVTAALWPDLAPDLAGNNLSVTLNYLHRALEPGRRPGEASYLLRVDGARVRLVTGRHLRPDTDDFDDHLAAARRAEADGIPSEALDRQLAAVALYRGDLFSDLGDLDWLTLDREHYRTRFVVAATRAAELLLGLGDTERAEHQAIAALRVDPHAEAAHDVLISAALHRGDRTTARSRFRRCIDALSALGLSPSATTCHLQRRLTGPPLPPQPRIPQPT